jgi:hypothetical protein
VRLCNGIVTSDRAVRRDPDRLMRCNKVARSNGYCHRHQYQASNTVSNYHVNEAVQRTLRQFDRPVWQWKVT